MSSLHNPDDCPIDLTVYNSNKIAHTNGEIEMYRIQGLEPKYVVLLEQNTTVELRFISNFHNGFNPPLQHGFEPALTPAPYSDSATRKPPFQSFRRTYIFLQWVTVAVAVDLAAQQIPEVLQQILKHLPF